MIVGRAEELRRLNDPQFGVGVHVRQHVIEHVRAGAEVGVEHLDELTNAAPEAVEHIAGLLHFALVGAAEVDEAELLGHGLDGGVALVVQDVHRQWPAVAKRTDVLPRVTQQFDRLAADRQEHVDGRLATFSLPVGNQSVVCLQVEVTRAEVDDKRDQVVAEREDHHRQEREQDRVLQAELDLRDHDTAEAHDRDQHERHQAALHIDPTFAIGRWGRHFCMLVVEAICASTDGK